MILTKYQALGNDYWVYDPHKNTDVLTPAYVKKICDRHYGLGGDGVLMGPKMDSDAEIFGLDIYNADGSLAEVSGNGLTIFSRYLWDEHKIGLHTSFSLHPSQKCAVKACVHDVHHSIMSEIFFQNFMILGEVDFIVPNAIVEKYNIPNQIKLIKVDMGNPHCVAYVKNPTKELACDLGCVLENHPLFPQRTNVQLVDWASENRRVRFEIWERGSGYTLGSGSSACAVACAYGYRFSLDQYTLQLQMPGGVLEIKRHGETISFVNQAFKIAEVCVSFDEGTKKL